MKKATALKLLSCLRHITWMGGPEGSLELEPGISSAGCQGHASKTPPPAWPDLPSLLPSLSPSLPLSTFPEGWGRDSEDILASRER